MDATVGTRSRSFAFVREKGHIVALDGDPSNIGEPKGNQLTLVTQGGSSSNTHSFFP